MSLDEQRYEMTTSLSIDSDSPQVLEDHTKRLEQAVVEEIADIPAITAYFVSNDHEALEIVIGLRFERMKAEYIEAVANEVLENAIAKATGATSAEPLAVREESTLVPA